MRGMPSGCGHHRTIVGMSFSFSRSAHRGTDWLQESDTHLRFSTSGTSPVVMRRHTRNSGRPPSVPRHRRRRPRRPGLHEILLGASNVLLQALLVSLARRVRARRPASDTLPLTEPKSRVFALLRDRMSSGLRASFNDIVDFIFSPCIPFGFDPGLHTTTICRMCPLRTSPIARRGAFSFYLYRVSPTAFDKRSMRF